MHGRNLVWPQRSRAVASCPVAPSATEALAALLPSVLAQILRHGMPSISHDASFVSSSIAGGLATTTRMEWPVSGRWQIVPDRVDVGPPPRCFSPEPVWKALGHFHANCGRHHFVSGIALATCQLIHIVLRIMYWFTSCTVSC